MDFNSFARRDLQFLCKKNGIPANLTNVAMAKALEALETVEGTAEIQQALGDHSFKINSPELPHTSRRTSSRRVTHGDEPSPLPRSHRKTVKTLEVTEMASKEDEIQETLIFQSPAVKSPELPRLGRRTSARRAALGEEPKIQQLNDLEVTDMAYKKVEGRKKEVPQILPKTPATRKAAKGVEAQSSRRRANKNEEVVSHTARRSTGVVTRRSTRLSSRKALEESVNTESKSRSFGRENSAVKMEALAKEDATEQEKEEGKTDLVEYGDPCAVTVEEHEEKHQEAESHEFSSYIDEDDSNSEVDNECEGIQEVTTKVLEATKMASKKENDKKAPKLLPTTRRSTRLSSKKPFEEKNREKGTDKMAAITEEHADKQEKVEEKKDFAMKIDSCVVAPAEEDEEEKKKEESHVALSQGYSSSIEVENDDSIVALVEEVENNDHEIESPGFSSSTQWEGSNFEGENRDSTVEQTNFSNVLVDDEGQKDQEESHDLSSFFGENSMEFESTEESSDQPPVNECVKDSSDQLAENEYLEVYQSPENKAAGYYSHLPENDLVEDSSNLGRSKFVEVSGDYSSDVKLASSAISDNSICGEIPPLLHKDAINYIQQPSGIEEEEAEKLCLLFTEMTLKEPEDCGDAFLKPAAAQDISFISKRSPATMVLHQHAEIATTADIAFPKANYASRDLPPALVIPSLFSETVEAATNLPGNEITAEAIGETPEVNESGGVITNDLPAVIDGLSNSDELSSSEKSVNAEAFQPQIPLHSTVELCVEFSGNPVAVPSPLKLPCESEIMSIVQNQSSEEAGMAATEIAEEKEQANAKALDAEVFVKDGNLKLLSLTKLRAMYKQMLNSTKTEQEEQKSITEQDFERLSCIKQDENCNQKLNDDMIKTERKKSLIKQEDLECLSRSSKLDSSCKLKLNEDTIKPERKRTPLKNLNYSTV